MTRTQPKLFVVCVENEGFPASLERRKIYITLPDADAEKLGMIRVVDESGDDYVYPKALFSQIDLPPALGKALLTA